MYVYLYYKTVLADMIEKKWQFFRLLSELLIDFNSILFSLPIAKVRVARLK